MAEFIGDYYPFDERMMRVVRGGSFNSEDETLRIYWRVGVLGDLEDHTIGFRCAVSDNE